MSRTNHAKREYEARTARDNEAYRHKIAARDANRQFREQIRELADWQYGWFDTFVSVALAT